MPSFNTLVKGKKAKTLRQVPEEIKYMESLINLKKNQKIDTARFDYIEHC